MFTVSRRVNEQKKVNERTEKSKLIKPKISFLKSVVHRSEKLYIYNPQESGSRPRTSFMDGFARPNELAESNEVYDSTRPLGVWL